MSASRQAEEALTASSGDILADRRFAYAEALMRDGDAEAAADLFAQTTERVPFWAPAWLSLGLAEERAGNWPAARRAMATAVALDPEDRLGSALHLGRITGRPPDGMAPRFVEALFDQYADRFEQHLIGDLGYRGPALIRDAIGRTSGPSRRFGEALDLGCGTGLMAEAMRDRVAAIDGVDLSPRMIAHARGKALYRELWAAELLATLGKLAPGGYDLALAADVFVYLGSLAEPFRAVAKVLRSGGLFAFTVQTWEGTGYRLGPEMRFSHAPRHVAEALASAGLAMVLSAACSTRRDAGVDVPGLVVVARSD